MTDKVALAEKKLISAFSTVADLVNKTARTLKDDGVGDTSRKLRELTGISKELYSIVKNTEEKDAEDNAVIQVIFDKEGEEWTK